MSWGVHDYPEPGPERGSTPSCPVCGEECEKVFVNRYNEPCGCDRCGFWMDPADIDDSYTGGTTWIT